MQGRPYDVHASPNPVSPAEAEALVRALQAEPQGLTLPLTLTLALTLTLTLTLNLTLTLTLLLTPTLALTLTLPLPPARRSSSPLRRGCVALPSWPQVVSLTLALTLALPQLFLT